MGHANFGRRDAHDYEDNEYPEDWGKQYMRPSWEKPMTAEEHVKQLAEEKHRKALVLRACHILAENTDTPYNSQELFQHFFYGTRL